MPVKANTALFMSFRGLYSDNPKAVSIELHKRLPNIKIYWAVSNNKKDDLPSYVTPILYGSSKYISLTYRAQIVVDNYNGIRKMDYSDNSSKIKKALVKFFCRKRKKQFNISTWHGTPLKHIAYDEINAKKGFHICSSAEYLVSGCLHTSKCFKSAFQNYFKIFNYGTPRNDIFFISCDRNRILKDLNIPINKKVILFAPTFRNNLEMGGLFQIRHIDINKLLNELSIKFGGEWVFVCRFHNNVFNNIPVDFFDSKSIINGNIHDDMADYLRIADILLTDYSSSMFDYILLKKPCFLYVPDLFDYVHEERGVYLDVCKLPFPLSESFDDLLMSIDNFKYDVFLNNLTNFETELGNYENGLASSKIVDDIVSFLSNGKKN